MTFHVRLTHRTINPLYNVIKSHLFLERVNNWLSMIISIANEGRHYYKYTACKKTFYKHQYISLYRYINWEKPAFVFCYRLSLKCFGSCNSFHYGTHQLRRCVFQTNVNYFSDNVMKLFFLCYNMEMILGSSYN